MYGFGRVPIPYRIVFDDSNMGGVVLFFIRKATQLEWRCGCSRLCPKPHRDEIVAPLILRPKIRRKTTLKTTPNRGAFPRFSNTRFGPHSIACCILRPMPCIRLWHRVPLHFGSSCPEMVVLAGLGAELNTGRPGFEGKLKSGM